MIIVIVHVMHVADKVPFRYTSEGSPYVDPFVMGGEV